MHLREGALAQQCAADRRLKQFRQFHEFVGCLGVQQALAGHDHRVMGGAQGLGSRLDVAGVALARDGPAGDVVEGLLADVFQSNVGWNLNRHGAAPSLP